MKQPLCTITKEDISRNFRQQISQDVWILDINQQEKKVFVEILPKNHIDPIELAQAYSWSDALDKLEELIDIGFVVKLRGEPQKIRI